MTAPDATHATSGSRDRRDVAARAVSEAFSPVVVAYGTFIGTGVVTTAVWWRGALLGCAVASLVAGLPYWAIVVASRRGLLSGRHIPDRRQRPFVLVLSMTSAALGLLLSNAAVPGRILTTVVVASLVGLAVAAAVSTFWKMSIHAAALGGATAIAHTLAGSAGWAALLVGGAVGAVVGWSRVRLVAHDRYQVVAGYLVGAAVAASAVMVLN